MLKTLRGIFISGLFILLGLTSFAQNNNTSSPFSRFGLGDLHPYSYGRFAGMGGASLGSRHQVQINSSNPASYAAIDSLSFIFEFGADGRISEYKSANSKWTTNDFNFRYFSFSFPVTHWAAATVGISPYADKGYEVYVEEDRPDIGRIGYSYFGTGTISKAYIGAGFNLTESLSVGANVYYLFGTLNQNNSIYFIDDPEQYGLSETEQTRMRDFAYLLGAQYDIKLKTDEFLTIGATFEKKANFTAFHSLTQDKILNYGGGLLTDSIKHIQDEPGKIQLPTSMGIGLSYTKLNKLEVNADYYHSAWGEAKFYGSTIPELTNQTRYSLGAEYIPEATSIRSYFKRVQYRAGIHLDKSYLKINNQQLNETGMSFGVGLPVGRSKSTINLAVELGRRGTVKDNLIRENYTKVSLYLKMFDRWFVQRKFD